MSGCKECGGTGWKTAPQLELGGNSSSGVRHVVRCECWLKHRAELLAKMHRRGRPPKPKPQEERLFPPSFRDTPPRGKVLAFKKKQKPEWYRCSADKEE
jgi:hypothetical protein